VSEPERVLHNRLGDARKFRERNKINLRLGRPIWIISCSHRSGQLRFDCSIATGFDRRAGRGSARCCWSPAHRGDARPVCRRREQRLVSICVFTKKPTRCYRAFVHWFGAVVGSDSFAILNIRGFNLCGRDGHMASAADYELRVFPLAIALWICGALGLLAPARDRRRRAKAGAANLTAGLGPQECAADRRYSDLWTSSDRDRMRRT